MKAKKPKRIITPEQRKRLQAQGRRNGKINGEKRRIECAKIRQAKEEEDWREFDRRNGTLESIPGIQEESANGLAHSNSDNVERSGEWREAKGVNVAYATPCMESSGNRPTQRQIRLSEDLLTDMPSDL